MTAPGRSGGNGAENSGQEGLQRDHDTHVPASMACWPQDTHLCLTGPDLTEDNPQHSWGPDPGKFLLSSSIPKLLTQPY